MSPKPILNPDICTRNTSCTCRTLSKMATMAELPYELLCYIMLLLVQSPGGAADFARMVSVCRNFILFAQDKHILKVVNFEIKVEIKNFKRYQYSNSLLVKCSEAGNVAAQFLLGKVILVSASQLLLGEWHKVECDFHSCDLETLSDLSCILATDVPTQDHKVGSFMAYFLPEQVFNSEVSQTRLVHYQLVKVFLLNGSHHDVAEMSVFLKSYIQFFIGVTEEGIYLLKCIEMLVFNADSIRCFEKQIMDINRHFACCEACEGFGGFEDILNAISNKINEIKSNLEDSEPTHFISLNLIWDRITCYARIVNLKCH